MRTAKMNPKKAIIKSGATLTFLAVCCTGCTAASASTAEHAATTSLTTQARGYSIPVSVQSDAAMRAAGNEGPTSSVLVPSSCVVTGTTATVTGTYRYRPVPAVYQRYGDVIDLYVFTGSVSGYQHGIQLAEPFTRTAPFIGGIGARWTVTVPVFTSLGRPARCMVAAQPTMDFEGAPSAY
jgi:hypothetical protein